MEKIGNKKKLYIKAGIILALVIAAAVLATIYWDDLMQLVENRELISAKLKSFGPIGMIVLFLLQVLQVIVAVIPSDAFNLVSGFVYGPVGGFIICYLGSVFGSVCAFSLARVLGYDFVKVMVPAKRIARVRETLNSTKGMLGVAIICLIPVIPKDILVYTAGITPIKPVRFLTVFCLAKIPSMLAMVLVGSAAGASSANTKLYIAIAAALAVILLVLFIFKDKLMKKAQD